MVEGAGDIGHPRAFPTLRPASLRGGAPLSGLTGAGLDPCGVVGTAVGLRPRASAGLPLAVRMRVALLNAPETELVVEAYDDAYAVVSGPEGNRAYQRDVLRAFDDNDSSEDEEAPASQLVQGETVMVGRTGHVATVERAPRAGDDEGGRVTCRRQSATPRVAHDRYSAQRRRASSRTREAPAQRPSFQPPARLPHPAAQSQHDLSTKWSENHVRAGQCRARVPARSARCRS